jgi:DNA-binding transcriptional LysR family regulator
VLPGARNTPRRTLESYVISHGGRLGRTLEIDTMFGMLRLIGESAWAAILPGVMMASAFLAADLCVNPLVGLPLFLELVAIQSAGRALPPGAVSLLDALEQTTEQGNRPWARLLEVAKANPRRREAQSPG